MELITHPNLADPDALFAALADAHRGLEAEASARLHARLVLLLANHIGDAKVISQAIDAAQNAAREAPTGR